MKNKIILLAALLICIIAFSCKKEQPVTEYSKPNLPSVAYKYSEIIYPNAFTSLSDNTPFGNAITDAGAALGRVLFYDSKLSINNAISCGSCHKQFRGFADGNDFSKGYQNMKTKRNSLSISNARFESSYFWDGRIQNLEEMVLAPIQNHIEMGMEKLDVLESKLSRFDYYAPLFENAFGSSEITKDKIADALAQFIRSLASFNTKFDGALANHFTAGLWGGGSSIDTSAWQELTPLENLGKNLFFVKLPCGGCHGSVNIGGTTDNFSNIGLDKNYNDVGWIPKPNFWSGTFPNGMFKVPSLRNVEVSAPYMHDGRFKTLEEVIDHYNTGIQMHPNLSFMLTNEGWNQMNGGITIDPLPQQQFVLTPLKMKLTDTDKQALIAFLKTLTDDTLIHDPKFSDPFVN